MVKKQKKIGAAVLAGVCLLTGNSLVAAAAEDHWEPLAFEKSQMQVSLGENPELMELLSFQGNKEELVWETTDSDVAVVDYSGTLYPVGEGYAMVLATDQTTGESAALLVGVADRQIEPVFYLQGDPAWELPEDIAKRACYATCFAMVMTNLGLEVTPKVLYEDNGSVTVNQRVAEQYGARFVSALPWNSAYFGSFDGERTWLKDDSLAQEAVKEALREHPQGVIVYFKRGDDAHGVVAVGTNEMGELIFMDPGTRRGENCSFEDTWVTRKGHDWSDFCYISTLSRQ